MLFFINVVLTNLVAAQRTVYFYDDLPIIPSVESTMESQSVSVEDIVQKQTLSYQSPTEIPKILPSQLYWLRFDFQPYLYLFNDYDTLYLNTFNFEKAWIYFAVEGKTDFIEIDHFRSNNFKTSL